MGISQPTKKVFTITDTTTTPTAVNYPFNIPQDCQGVVVRVYNGAITGTGSRADVYFQTTDDGGTTWRDCVHFGQLTSATVLQNAQFQPIPVMGGASYPGLGGFVGSVAASTSGQGSVLGTGRVTGLPILSTMNRIQIRYGGTTGFTNGGVNVDVFMNAQDSAI